MRLALSLVILATLSAEPSSRVGDATTKSPVLHISSDGEALEVRRSTDASVQRVNILAQCGLPAIGAPRIRDIRESGGVVAVTFGKHCSADVSLADLSVRCAGCD